MLGDQQARLVGALGLARPHAGHRARRAGSRATARRRAGEMRAQVAAKPACPCPGVWRTRRGRPAASAWPRLVSAASEARSETAPSRSPLPSLAPKPARGTTRHCAGFRASATFEAVAPRAHRTGAAPGATRARAAPKSTSSAGEAACPCTGVWRARRGHVAVRAGPGLRGRRPPEPSVQAYFRVVRSDRSNTVSGYKPSSEYQKTTST
jgi:hypothetical protein